MPEPCQCSLCCSVDQCFLDVECSAQSRSYHVLILATVFRARQRYWNYERFI